MYLFFSDKLAHNNHIIHNPQHYPWSQKCYLFYKPTRIFYEHSFKIDRLAIFTMSTKLPKLHSAEDDKTHGPTGH